jgi:hypothetical protein
MQLEKNYVVQKNPLKILHKKEILLALNQAPTTASRDLKHLLFVRLLRPLLLSGVRSRW